MKLLQMSISAGVLIILILLLRRVGRRLLSARCLFWLWFVAAFRMLAPVDIPVNVQVMPMEGILSAMEEDEMIAVYPENAVHGWGQENKDKNGLPWFSQAAVIIWLNVAVILMTTFVILYMRQRRSLEESIPLKGIPYLEKWRQTHPRMREVGFMYSDRIISPVTYGIWNPRIVFPRDMNFEDTETLGHILRHEYIHICRYDNLWKVLMMAAVCVHWFNPLAWVMWRCFNRDMELACDQGAVKGMDGSGRAAYAMTLLRFAEKGRNASLICNGFGKSAVKERILEIMSHRKQTKLGIVCSIFVMASSMTVFASPNISQTSAYHAEGKSPARILSETAQFKEYETLGLYYDSEIDWISYNSRGVGYFSDDLPDGTYNRMNDLAGSVCLVAERSADGRLTGFKEVEKTAYLKNASDVDRRRAQERGYIKEYGPYGVQYDENTGYLSYKGRLVEAFRDSKGCGVYVNGAVASLGDTTCLQIVRAEDGSLSGIEEVTPEQMSELLQQTIGVSKTGDGWKGGA